MKAPACRSCSRKGWVWDGPSRIICPTCKGTGSREPAGIVLEGERGAEKRFARQEARAYYFEHHRTNDKDEALARAVCQFSGREMIEKVSRVDAAHKERRWKGDDTPENMCAVLHDAHEWQGQNREAEAFLVASAVNIITGGVVAWPAHLKADLQAWLLHRLGPLKAQA